MPRDELAAREKIMVVDPVPEPGEAGEVEGGDGASGGPEIANVGVLPDGALKPLRAELLALAWADGWRAMEAWDISGGGAKSYRQRIERAPAFKERVRALTEERTKLEQEGVLGEAMWAAKQNWRLARAGGVVAEIHRATVLLVETTKAFSGIQPVAEGAAPAPAAEGEVPRGPGRPPHQPRALRVDVGLMREKLIGKGVAAAAPEGVQ